MTVSPLVLPPLTRVAVRWRPGFHARAPERLSVRRGLVAREKRDALNALLRRTTAGDRILRAFQPPFYPSRWTDGSFPAFYVAKDPITAMWEKLHHDARWLARARFAPHDHSVELLQMDVAAECDDVGPLRTTHAALFHDTDYSAAQQLAAARRAAGAQGILYPSVREAEGACAALFVREAVARPAVHKSVRVHWTGSEFELEEP